MSEQDSRSGEDKKLSDLVDQADSLLRSIDESSSSAKSQPSEVKDSSGFSKVVFVVAVLVGFPILVSGLGLAALVVFNGRQPSTSLPNSPDLSRQDPGPEVAQPVVEQVNPSIVTVGILHSLTGTMAISESTLVDAEKMAINEINAAGGVEVDGKKYKINYIIEDGASDWPTFAEKSKKLIDQDQVPVVFGGWTSASRKAMLPVYESKNAFLFYPIQYEGQECSNNIFYTGATPNQQSEPATKFMYE